MSTPKFNHTDLLKGYDMTVAITAKTINDQLQSLFDQKIIHHDFEFSAKSSPGPNSKVKIKTDVTLKAELDAPKIQILPGSGNARKVMFQLNMPSGKLTSNLMDDLNFKDWKYVFSVDLDMQAIELKDIQDHVTVPQEVKDHLEKFNPEMFTIRHLFMDFENADLATYDKARSSCPLPASFGGGDLTKSNKGSNGFMLSLLQACLEGYFNNLKGSKNPFILGYSISANKSLEHYDIQPTFNPTGSSFSVTYNKETPDLSTVNFLIKTDNQALPTAEGAGLFDSPWITTDDHEGRFIIAESLFLGKWLLPKITDSFKETVGGGKLTQTPTGWNLNHVKTLENIPEVEYIKGVGTSTFNMDISVSNDANGIAKVHMKAKYHLYIKWRKQVVLAYEYDAWSDQKWDGTIAVSTEENGEIKTLFSQNIGKATSGYSKNGPAKFLNILSIGTDRDFIDNEGQYFAQWFDTISNAFGRDLTMDLQTRFVMPAGNIFKFKNLHFDNSGDIICDVNYTEAAKS